MKSLLFALIAGLAVQSRSTLPVQTDWTLGALPGTYSMEAKGRATTTEGAVITVRSTVAAPAGAGSAVAFIAADSLRGGRVILTGEVRTSEASGGASLWVRIDEGATMLLLENGMANPQRGTVEWTRRSISLPVPPEATRIAFGLVLQGAGVATVRALQIDAGPAIAADVPMAKPVAEFLDTAIALTRRNALKSADVDWNVVEPRVRALASGAAATADAYPAISYMLGRLGDRHSSLMPPAQSVRFASGAIPNPVPEVRAVAEGVGYISVPAYVGSEAQTMQTYATRVHAALGDVRGAASCGFVVDLRGNGGGNMWPMLAGLAPFLGIGPLGTFESAGRSSSPWLANRNFKIAAPVALSALESSWVAVITGPRTASSGEAVAVAFRGRPRARSFGQPTAGLSTSNATFPLPNGSMLYLTTAVFADRTGRRYGAAIEPDEVVTPVDGSDAALTAAFKWLRESSRCAAPVG